VPTNTEKDNYSLLRFHFVALQHIHHTATRIAFWDEGSKDTLVTGTTTRGSTQT